MEVEKFEEFFRQFYEKDLLAVAAKGGKSITIDFSLLDKFDPNLADKLLNDPEAILDAAREAITHIDFPEGKVELEPRFKNLPETTNIRIRNLRSEHIGKFISLDGVVRRASEVKPEVSVAIYQCPDCGNKIHVIQKDRILTPPSMCDCGRKGKFELIDSKLFDSRWLYIEEPYEVSAGEGIGTVSVYLKNDLTTPEMQRKTDPGNRIKVNGIVRETRKIYRGKMKTQMDIFIDANYVEPTELEWEEVIITPDDEKAIKDLAHDPEVYNKIVSSIAPSIYGMDRIKEAIMLQLFGGVQHLLPDRTKIRGDIHILLLGDPSTAKSQLLKLISGIIPRGKYVGGRGATTAGLTATVVRDEEFMGGWVLEAGAMVLANKGVLAVDEFDKMSKEDQIAMHEALEQQTVSVAKASIVATLPAQVSVLAGANPKYSRFDPYRPIAQQIEIPDTLLARFDLKFALRDIPDKERDEKLATHILETRLKPEKVTPLISPEFLRKYVAYARKNCKPKPTKEALERLKNFYIDMRGLYAGEDTVAITLRQNEALMRLAEASAKIRLSDKVEVIDAERAINIMRFSLEQLAREPETGRIDIDRTEGMPSSQRTKILAILDIIDMLEKKLGKPVPKEEVIAAAEDQGIKEKDTEEFLRRLKADGSIFEPKLNYVERIK
ncbi:MAG: minichromosome maintenance protein MCM [Candidatus Aenigmatarchaeota archaeon]